MSNHSINASINMSEASSTNFRKSQWLNNLIYPSNFSSSLNGFLDNQPTDPQHWALKKRDQHHAIFSTQHSTIPKDYSHFFLHFLLPYSPSIKLFKNSFPNTRTRCQILGKSGTERRALEAIFHVCNRTKSRLIVQDFLPSLKIVKTNETNKVFSMRQRTLVCS